MTNLKITLTSAIEDILSILTTMLAITAYTIYYTITFTLSLFPLVILGGGITGLVGGLPGLPDPPIVACTCVGIPIVLHCVVTLTLLLWQVSGIFDEEVSWLGLLVYSVGAIWSVAVGLVVSWVILDKIGRVAWWVLEWLGWVPEGLCVPGETGGNGGEPVEGHEKWTEVAAVTGDGREI